MQPSRLAQRKLVKVEKKNFPLKIIFYALIPFALVIGIFAYLLIFHSWDEKEKLTIASQDDSGNVSIEILDPQSNTINTIEIPKETQVEAANELGTWKLGSITKLGIDKNLGGDFLKNTLIKSFKFPIDAWTGNGTNLSFLDKIKIKLFSLSVGNTGQVNLNLKDTSYLQRAELTDGSLGWQINSNMPTNVESFFSENPGNLNVSIKNGTGETEEGNMMGKVIEVLGANVAAIENLDRENYDCKVIGAKNIVTFEIIKIFGCTEINLKPANNFDLEVDLGTKFKDRF